MPRMTPQKPGPTTPRPAPFPYRAMGARFLELRLAAKLTQQELAVRAGVSHAYPSRIEQGRDRPNPGLLRKLVRILQDAGAPADYWELGGLAGYFEPPPQADPEKASLLRRLGEYPAAVLRVAERTARAIALEADAHPEQLPLARRSRTGTRQAG